MQRTQDHRNGCSSPKSSWVDDKRLRTAEILSIIRTRERVDLCHQQTEWVYMPEIHKCFVPEVDSIVNQKFFNLLIQKPCIPSKTNVPRQHEDYLHSLRRKFGGCLHGHRFEAGYLLRYYSVYSQLRSKNTKPPTVQATERDRGTDTRLKVPCVISAASEVGCDATDFVCQCENSEEMFPSAEDCVVSACGSETASELLSAASGVCAACF